MDETPAFRMVLGLGTIIAFAACAGVKQNPGTGAAGSDTGAGTTGGSRAGGQTGGSSGLGSGGTMGGSLAPASRDAVDPSVPPGAAQAFAAASSPTVGSIQIVYPNANAVIPPDLAALDVQWNAVPGATAYRVSLRVDTGDILNGYVAGTDYLPAADDWTWLLARAAGHTLQIQIEAATLDGSGAQTGGLTASTPQALRVASDAATGALFYFGTTGTQVTGSGTLFRLPVGAVKPAAFLNSSITNGLCVGCHTLTRDGKRMAFAYDDVLDQLLGAPMTLGNVDVNNPAQNQAPNGTASAAGTFNPDGSKLLTSSKGKLTLRTGGTGVAIADVPLSGPAMYPDWSPDGGKVVFVRPQTPCTATGLLGSWGQDSVIVFGGALVTIDYDAASETFGNEQVIFPSENRNAYYPSYSPDGAWIAFTRTDGVTKMTWSGANTACAGMDGTAGSYDNASATTWLLSTQGGNPVELAAANGEPMHTNSWPKWGPRKDSDYLWLSFTSTRPYGNVLTGANAHHQLWITGIRKAAQQDIQLGDPSSPAVWFPFQDTVTKNHVGQWSVNVTTFTID